MHATRNAHGHADEGQARLLCSPWCIRFEQYMCLLLIGDTYVQGMQESYQLYAHELKVNLPHLQKGPKLAQMPPQRHRSRHTNSHMLITTKSHLNTDAVALVSAFAQWMVVVVLCLLVYCWCHRNERDFGLPVAALEKVLISLNGMFASLKFPKQTLL